MSADAAAEFLEMLVPAVNAAMREHAVPGCAIGVSVDGARAFMSTGVTSTDDPLPVTSDTLFQIGSISKTFVALLVARHAAKGDIALGDPVTCVLPGRGIDPRITFRHLLTHSSGISGDRMISDAPRLLANGGADGLDVAIRHLARQPLDFAPGSDWSYSNAGIMLAAAALERLDARPYAEQLAAEVLHPLGMTHSCTSADEAITHRVAVPHGVDANGRPTVLRDAGWQQHWQLPGWDIPGGGIISSARDMLVYAEHMMSSTEPSALTTPQRHRDGDGEHFGLAWYIDDVAGVRTLWHDGLTTGYCSRLITIPARTTGVIVLTNGTGGDAVHKAAAQVVAEATTGAVRRNIAWDPRADTDTLTGDYDAGIYGILRLTKTSGTPGGMVDVRTVDVSAGAGFRLPPVAISRLAIQFDGNVRVVAPVTSRSDETITCRRDSTGRTIALRIGDRLAPRISGTPTGSGPSHRFEDTASTARP